GLHELSAHGVEVMDIPGLVGLYDGLLAVDGNDHRGLRDVEVPGIARNADIAPCHFASVRVDGNDAGSADVIQLATPAVLRVPLVGVRGAGVIHLGSRIPRTDDPRTRTAELLASGRPRVIARFTLSRDHRRLPLLLASGCIHA